ncbi:MAG TPA: peptide chain release factor H, partial [Cytophagales bacterium]|nr:peptide chain release factor H [Cytophagales bacterium]
MDNLLLQITAGRGPAECAWVVAQVQKVLLAAAREAGYAVEIRQREPGPQAGTLNSVVVQLQGPEVKAWANSWQGTIQWVGQSPYRKYHKRKNWFVSVQMFAEATAKTGLAEHEVRYQFIRSGGPGGQHVNKVATAVRATHLPTGETVHVAGGRSQAQNKQEALRRLQA